MKDVLKQQIIEFQETTVPKPTPRQFVFPALPKNVRKGFVLVGMRRSGKTYALYERIHQLLEAGVKKRKLLYLNFEDDRLAGMKLADMQTILDAYFELFPDLIDADDLTFFFDEVHEVPGWEKFIRRLLDRERMQLYLTGSSAKLLSTEIASSLRGRTFVHEVFPFSFPEYLLHKGKAFSKDLSSKQKAHVNHELDQFLKEGGFPEGVGLTWPVHVQLLQGYVETVLYRDIIERFEVKNIGILRRLVTHCLKNPATPFSVNKMYHTFKSQGLTLSKNALYEYMGYLEDAYCVFSLPAQKTTLKSRKLYPIDHGFVPAFDFNFELKRTVECAVFSHLKRRAKELTYFITQKGREVDFFAHFPDQTLSLVQVSHSGELKTKALEEAMAETGLKTSTIVTLDEKKTLKVSSGTVHVVSLSNYLLGD